MFVDVRWCGKFQSERKYTLAYSVQRFNWNVNIDMYLNTYMVGS